jgi:hypothetical protein
MLLARCATARGPMGLAWLPVLGRMRPLVRSLVGG